MPSISVIKPDKLDAWRRLARLNDPPRRLFIRGDYDPLQPAVAMVGSRKYTAYGRQVAERMAGDLARRGVRIVSGLALGIDSLAHQAALAAGGQTIAVLPSGIDLIYPASHRRLGEQISRQGALISEYPPGTSATRYSFVARNRIVAALGDVLVVVEAAAKSGTLITAEYALDMGISVLAVPGPITSPTSVGTNRLIGLGAKPVLGVADILVELGLDPDGPSAGHTADNADGQAILDALKPGSKQFSELSQLTGLRTEVISRELTHLELNGQVVCLGNNVWALN